MSARRWPPYQVVTVTPPCAHCQQGEMWAIQGPTPEEHGSTDYGDQIEASEAAGELNAVHLKAIEMVMELLQKSVPAANAIIRGHLCEPPTCPKETASGEACVAYEGHQGECMGIPF